jgi:4'-phosphopantetheinyl transferase
VSETAEVGIDIEQIYRDCPVDDLASRYFSAREYAWLRQQPEERRLQDFYRLWTFKEAVLKCAGVGLSVSPASVQVWLDRDAHVTCSDPKLKAVERLFVREFSLIDGYASAVAVDAVQANIDVVREY